jgi:hypothetical protein
MKPLTKTILALGILAVYLFSMIAFASAILVDTNYITVYPEEEGKVSINVENNENFDIESVSVSLVLSTLSSTGQVISVPFAIIGSSTKDLDDLDEDDDDSASFTLRASNDAKPGDYNIPYVIKYKEVGDSTTLTNQGTFSIRVSAETDLDFGADVKGVTIDSAIVGQKGKITLEIINKGLGDLKSMSVDITPQGYDLISQKKVFVGTISAEDSDSVSFDVLFTGKNPVLTAQVTFKDADNQEQTKTITITLKAYTQQEALQLGLIKKSNTTLYVGVIIAVVLIWYIWRRISKARKKRAKEREKEMNNGGMKR